MPGGPHPFDVHARAHRDALFAFALRLSGDAADGTDLVQDTFQRALRRFDQLEPGSNVRAWLFSILHNTFIDRCRSRAAAPRTQPVDDVDAPASEPRIAPLSAKISAEQLRRAIAALEDDFRTVYEMHALQGRSYQDISSQLGIPVNTVGTRLARARRKLCATLTAVVDEDGGEP